MTTAFFEFILKIMELIPVAEPLAIPEGIEDGFVSMFGLLGFFFPYSIYAPLIIFTKENKEIFGRYYWSSRNLCRSPNLYFKNVEYDSLPLATYHIPRTQRKMKYYTFFPGQTDFHFNSENPSSEDELFSPVDGVLYCPPSPADLAVANSAAILSDLNDFENMHNYSLDGFEEV